MATRVIRVPALHKRIAEKSGRVAIEHAALDWRAVEFFAALALVRGGVNAIITGAPHLARQTIEGVAGKKARFESWYRSFGIRVGRTQVWVFPQRHDLQDLPFKALDGLYVTDAHAVAHSPVARLAAPRRDLFVAGWPAEPTTWWRDYFEDGRAEILKLPAAEIVAAFPDQVAAVIQPGKPGHRRLMLLEEEPIERKAEEAPAEMKEMQPIHVFTRERLRVRTEREAHNLTPEQVADARAQLGKSWRPGKHGTPLVRFELSPAQRRYVARKRHARARGFDKFIVLKDRRVGITTTEQAESYQIVATSPRSWVATLAHTDPDSRLIFETVKTFHRSDPAAPRAVGNSKKALELENQSKFFVGSAGSPGFARGSALRRFHGSEVAKWMKKSTTQDDDVDELMAGILPGLAGEAVLESTAQGFDWYKRKWDESIEALKRGETDGYFPIFLAWFENPGNRMAPGRYDPVEIVQTQTEEERELVAKHGLDPAQIAWRRSKIRTLGKRFKQEYPEDPVSAFIQTGSVYFDTEIVTRILDSLPADSDVAAWRAILPDYKHRELLRGAGYETIYREPIPGRQYVIGGDCSQGIAGGDPNGYGVLDRDTLEQVATIHGLFSIPDQAENGIRLSKKYNDAILGIEAENHGHAVLQKVIDLGYGRGVREGGCLYYHGSIKAAMSGTAHDRLERAGWSTNGGTRDAMYADLASAIERGGMTCRDALMLRECFTFKLQRSGKYEASGKDHDDALAKWAIALQMLRVKKARAGIFVMDGSV